MIILLYTFVISSYRFDHTVAFGKTPGKYHIDRIDLDLRCQKGRTKT